MSESTDALATALQAEYAAVFAFGVIASRAAESRADLVATSAADHRARRDALAEALRAADEDVPPAAIGYRLGEDVTDAASAARAAVTVEQDCAEAYRAGLERTDTPELRTLCLDGLTATAIRRAKWRLAAGLSPSTTALPGDPTTR